jgi:hypothetical protein
MGWDDVGTRFLTGVVMWCVASQINTQQMAMMKSWDSRSFGAFNMFKWSHDDRYVAVAKSKHARMRGGADAVRAPGIHAAADDSGGRGSFQMHASIQ